MATLYPGEHFLVMRTHSCRHSVRPCPDKPISPCVLSHRADNYIACLLPDKSLVEHGRRTNLICSMLKSSNPCLPGSPKDGVSHFLIQPIVVLVSSGICSVVLFYGLTWFTSTGLKSKGSFNL